MKYEEIIKLLDAGYTRDEIMAMKDDNETKAPDPKEKKTDDSNVDTKAPEETEMSGLVKEMRDAFAEMRKEFTAFNIMASRQPEEKTPEDIIANIINPTRKENKKGDK